MCPRATIAAVFLTLPVAAYAQTASPAVYVCTPDAVVHKIVGTSSSRLFNGTGTFRTCDLGPDGNLFIGNDFKILRINPTDKNTAKNQQAVVGTLPYPVHGLSFNGPVLYANTPGGVYKFVGDGADPLTFSVPSLVEPGDPLQAAAGLVFDVIGNLLFAKNGDVRRLQPSPNPGFVPHYSAGTQIVLAGASAYGLAAPPCRDLLYGDTAARLIKRIPTGGGPAQTVASLGLEVPLHVTGDAGGSVYVVAAANLNGNNANVYRYDFNGLLNCTSPQSRTLLLSVPRAVGIAVAPREVSMTQHFAPTDCQKIFDFGHHKEIITLGTCGSGEKHFSLQIVARQSEPSSLTYTEDLDPATTTHFNYSTLRGYATELLLHAVSCPAEPCTQNVAERGGYTAQYWFSTQDVTAVPAVGRGASESASSSYHEAIPLLNFWDLGFDPGGQFGRGDFSKYLALNLNPPGLCEARPEDFEAPLTGLLTPAQGGSSLKIAFVATGENCSGGTLRLSIAKISDDPTSGCNPLTVFDIQTIEAVSTGAQTGNILSNTGDRYWYNLKTSGHGVGTFRFTISGPKLRSVGGCYIVSQ